MRVLQVHDKAPGEGGIAAHVAFLSAALVARGHVVETLRVDSRMDLPRDGSKGDDYRLPYSYGIVAGIRQRARLGAILRRARPDVIHLHECFTALSPVLLAAMRRTAPVVGTLHDVRPFCFLMTRRFTPTDEACVRRCGLGCFASGCVRPRDWTDTLRLVRRWAADGLSLSEWRRVDRVVVPSTYLQELALMHGLDATRLRVVPHGTGLGDEESAWADRPSPARIVYLGSLVEHKGVEKLFDALALLADRQWRVDVIGDGALRACLERRCARDGVGERVRFWGHLERRKEVDRLLARARMVVVPSLVPESFGMVGIEAFAMATPVVTFGLGGVREWIRDGENGLIAAARDSADLARKMRVLLDDAHLARRMGEAGRSLVAERFTPESAIEALLGIYHDAATRGGRRPPAS